MKKLGVICSFLLMICMVVSCSKKDNKTDTNAPVACFTVSNDTINPGETVTFTSCTQNATSITWDFGDGASGISGDVVTHPYYTGGTYTVSLTAVNGTAHQVAQHTVTVRSALNGQYKGTYSSYDEHNNMTNQIANLMVNISISGTMLSISCLKNELSTSDATLSGNSFTWTATSAPYTYYGSGTLTDNGVQKSVSMTVAIRNGAQSLGSVKYDGTKQ